jgi:cytosine/creatinine deaminase
MFSSLLLFSTLLLLFTHKPQAEMSAFEKAGKPKYAEDVTLFTTLVPCDMCTGACLWFGIKRVVMGEKRSVPDNGDELLKSKGVEVINMDSEECYQLLQKWIKENPEKWRPGS